VQQLTALARQLAQAQMTQVAIAQSLAIGVVAFECPDGRVRFANRTACDWLPIQPGDNLRDCLIPQWLTAWPEKTDQPAPIEVQQGDRWFTLQFVWAAPLSNDCLLILEDCTARKQLEANLNKQIQELQWLAKLRDDMIGSISHELRSPLTNMLLAIELLKTAQSQTEAERHMQILEAECLRERDFINDLLSLQNSQPLRRSILIQPLNLADWLQDILTPFQARAATRQQTITYRCEPGLPLLQTDAISLERICKELITNACKYTPVGESIVIQVFRQAPNICISVKNLGVTIPPAELPRIFEKFYRIPESDPWKQGGTGMGLAIVQRLAQQIKAEITVQSESDVTEFLLRIPVNLPLSDSFDPD
jgi:signal transduction histidine kinase